MTTQTNTLDATLRTHDAAFYNWIGTLPVDYGSVAGVVRNGFPILRIFASPHQAFAKVTELLVLTGWVPGANDEERRAAASDLKWPNLPVPFVSLERGEPTPDAEQAGNAKSFHRVQLDRATGRWMAHPWPRHYATTYKATFWAEKRYTDAYIREWVYTQMGPVGVGQRERLIPVAHPLPWGTQLQRLRLESSRDLSSLEGEEQRILRVEFEFAMRTLVFLPPIAAGAITYGVGFDSAMLSLESGDTDPNSIVVQEAGHTSERSDNLFYFPYEGPDVARLWPVTGEGGDAVCGTLAPGARGPGFKADSLKVAVSAPTDAVELLERINVLDSNTAGKVIVGVSFSYLGHAGTSALQLRSVPVDGGPGSKRFLRPLPPAKGWTPVHLFMLSDQVTSVLELIGTGADASLTLHGIDVRFEYDTTNKTAYQSSSGDESETVYQWANMGKRPYLVVGTVQAAEDDNYYDVTAQDDAITPVYPQTQPVSPVNSRGFVFLVQPTGGSILVRVPSSLAIDSLYAQPYDGPYNGNTV